MDTTENDKQHDPYTNKTTPKSYTKELVEGDINHEEKTRQPEEDPETRCGYWSCRPKSLQCCNNAKCLLIFLSFCVLAQGFVVNGINNVSTTSIERRFQLSSSRVGLISSSHEFSAAILGIFISFFGSGRRKAKWLAWSSIAMAIGSIITVLAHFTSGKYEWGQFVQLSCFFQDKSTDCDGDSKLQNFLYVLILGQLFIGVGSATLYTVGLSLIDDSVPSSSSPLYIGIWYAFASLGPGIGYIVGGRFLSLYVDFESVSDVDIATEDPRWVGAWWLGFVLAAICFILAAIPISMFGAELPSAKHVRDTRVSEVHCGDEIMVNVVPSKNMTLKELKYLPKQVWQLLKNPPFMFVTLAGLTEGLGATGYATFIPKFIQNQYDVDAAWAATLAGIAVVPGAIVGQFFGGMLCKRLNLTVKGYFRVPIVTCGISLLLTGGLWARCDLRNISGISKDYANTSNVILPELTTTCNENCHCDTEWYVPVCDSYGTQYFSPCYAGCTMYSVETKTFSNCACVPPAARSNETSVTNGKCSSNCNMLYVYLAVTGVAVFFLFFPTPTAVAASLRCVQDDQRTFSLGIKLVLIRLLGTVPGPVIFGTVIDNACILWQEKCDEETSCWIYDKFQLSRNMFTVLVCIKSLSVIFFTLAYKLYKPPKSVKSSTYEIKTQSANSENSSSAAMDTYL